MIENEKQLQDAMHRLMHTPPESVCWKEQDVNRAGIPDHTYIRRGWVTRVELKFVYTEDAGRDGRFRTGLKPGQRRHLREWGQAGGCAYLLIAVEDVIPDVMPYVFLVGWEALPSTDERVSRTGLAERSLRRGPCVEATLAGWRDEIFSPPSPGVSFR